MEFFKIKTFRRSHKEKVEMDINSVNGQSAEELAAEKAENGDAVAKETSTDTSVVDMDDEDDDDDDFITNEVKRRLKELRKNSFMVLIPEESCLEDEEEEEREDETSSSEWRGSEAGDGYSWCQFDAVYDKYCERMLFFDKMIFQQLRGAGSTCHSNPSPKSASKKLVLTLRSLSFKKKDELNEDTEYLHQEQAEVDPYESLQTAYVAHICLCWEALNCQYMQLSQHISSQPEDPSCYSYAAQAFQQFQVLLQRFIENEPFEDGSRVEIYARARNSLPKLLQVPCFQDFIQTENREDSSEFSIQATDLLKVMEDSILIFRHFLKTDKNKSNHSLHLFGGHNQSTNALQLVQNSLDKKEIKLKELSRKKKGRKKKCWPVTKEEIDLLFGLIDIKVVSRVLRMKKISKEQLLWCEAKMSKLDISENGMRYHGSPVLFPC